MLHGSDSLMHPFSLKKWPSGSCFIDHKVTWFTRNVEQRERCRGMSKQQMNGFRVLVSDLLEPKLKMKLRCRPSINVGNEF